MAGQVESPSTCPERMRVAKGQQWTRKWRDGGEAVGPQRKWSLLSGSRPPAPVAFAWVKAHDAERSGCLGSLFSAAPSPACAARRERHEHLTAPPGHLGTAVADGPCLSAPHRHGVHFVPEHVQDQEQLDRRPQGFRREADMEHAGTGSVLRPFGVTPGGARKQTPGIGGVRSSCPDLPTASKLLVEGSSVRPCCAWSRASSPSQGGQQHVIDHAQDQSLVDGQAKRRRVMKGDSRKDLGNDADVHVV